MTICEFCLLQSADGSCGIGLNVPKTMRCRDFSTGIEKFCANPADFVSPAQIVEMARFFGLNGTELKKVKIVADQRVLEGELQVS